MITPEQAVLSLDSLAPDGTGDNEAIHGAADGVLLAVVPPEVAAAWRALADRIDFWYV